LALLVSAGETGFSKNGIIAATGLNSDIFQGIGYSRRQNSRLPYPKSGRRGKFFMGKRLKCGKMAAS